MAEFRENTREDYRRDLERHAAPYFGRMRLAEIQPVHIKQWLTKLADDGYAAGTIRNCLAPVRAMLADAAKRTGSSAPAIRRRVSGFRLTRSRRTRGRSRLPRRRLNGCGRR